MSYSRNATGQIPSTAPLGDFTTDQRVLTLIAMALCVGSGGAAAAWVLIKLITLTTNLVWFGRLDTISRSLGALSPSAWIVAAPALGGLVIGLMARFGSEKIRGHGIPEAIEAILIGGSRLQPKVALLKPLSSAISIGTGGPFGAEGPIIMTGGAIGSLFAQCFHLSAAERKTLLVAGAASGMTAIFGTPIAAVLLAVELLLFEWKPRSFLPVVAATLVSAAWRPVLLGSGPLFPFAAAFDLPWWGLPACVGIGIIAGFQSGLMTVALYKAEDLFHRLPLHWMWWPVIGGVAVGLGGLIEPRAMGVGYDVIGDLLSPGADARAVLGILVVKALIWVIALASGTSGGVLAPLLILGGSSGWLIGLALPGAPSQWALLGMAAMMGGSMRAPLTGVLFGVELTGDLHALLPLLAATGASYAVTVLLLKRSILTEKIARRGHHISCEYSTDPFELLRASDVMVTAVDTLPAGTTVDAAVDYFMTAEHRHKSYPLIDDDGRLVGMAGRTEVLRWRGEGGHGDVTLDEAASDRSLFVGHPDTALGRLVEQMIERGISRVPIVDPATRRLLGLVARKDLFKIRSGTIDLERNRSAYIGRRPRI